MSRLVIIGNGFDLWHGLPTNYLDFYKYHKNSLDQLDMFFIGVDGKAIPWSDFENNLSSFDWESFFHNYNEIDFEDDTFKPSMLYGLEDELAEEADILVESIRDLFCEWISSIVVADCASQITFNDSDRFLNFNYTSTLQLVYRISDDRVFHIHGREGYYEDLVFGHGAEIVNEPEIDEEGNSLRTPFSDSQGAAKTPLHALKKPVDVIIHNHVSYFASLVDVTEILVIGHSLNDIDLPYFKKVSECAPTAKWTIVCYQESEFERVRLQLSLCNVSKQELILLPSRGFEAKFTSI
ncbi:bacteriophage abortive infection AbiH family protein [Rheinheimera soli]|uniref:bacteriophage abortive infection AbiH family protein n=1 Tax=Rheinheimera soli TaxID=443616 RepID=UPI001E342C1F|nr:bacteriophage abortive infection AbiH family protein [Rheinheimera soli]